MSRAQGRPPAPQVAAPRGERLPRAVRLSRRGDFLRCYRTGRRRHGTLATLHFVGNGLGFARLGITASRKVGKAVVRQRLKRRVREVFRRWDRRSSLPALDVVVHLKPEAATASFLDLKNLLESQLRSLLVQGPPREPGPDPDPRAA